MGLIVKSSEAKQILISGTEFVVEQVYGRISFVGLPNGRSMEIATGIFANQQMYEEGKYLYTNIESLNFQVNIAPEESQSIDTALKYAIMGFEQMGYIAEIVADTPIVEEPINEVNNEPILGENE